MKKRPLTTVEILGIVFLLILAIGAAWYLFFYKPLQAEIAEINNQSNQIDSNIQVATAKLAKMNGMQKELDEIFAESAEPSEIAAYDNSQAVMTELHAILSTAKQYSLNFANPSIDGNGIARRSVTLSFSAGTYAEAKTILKALEENHWRCIINNISFSGSAEQAGGLTDNIPVSVSASLTFFESTKIKAEETPAA